MNSTKFILALAISFTVFTSKAMAPNVMKTIDGHDASITDKIIKTVASSSTLEQACKDIRALANTNKEMKQFLNSPYNTNVIIRELAALYTSGKVVNVAEMLKTRGACQVLYDNLKLVNPNELLSANRNDFTYFSLLPEDIFRKVINQRIDKLSYEQLIQFFTNNPTIVKDNFRLLYYVAQKAPLFRSNQQAALIGTAQVLNTKESRRWLASITPSPKDAVGIDFCVATMLIDQHQYKEAHSVLEEMAKQNINPSIKAEAQLAIAKLFVNEKIKTSYSKEYAKEYAHLALDQMVNIHVRGEALQLCIDNKIEFLDVIRKNPATQHERDLIQSAMHRFARCAVTGMV